MGVEIQIPIGMSWFSINLYNEIIVLASDQGVQEGDLVIIFFFNGKGDVLINSVKWIMERVNCVSFNDAETVVNVTFPYLSWNRSCVDGHLFDCFHT